MRPVSELLERLERISEVSIVVGEVVGWPNNRHLETIDHDCLSDASVEDWVLGLGIRADHDQKIGFIDTHHLRIHQVRRAQVSVEVRCVTSHIKVIAVESVEKIFEGHNALDILELANYALDLIATDTL